MRRKSSHNPLARVLERLEDRCTPAVLPSGFEEAAVATGISAGTAMEVAPNGDVWVLQQGGVLKRFFTGNTAGDTVADVSTLGLNASGERGLLGIAFDPSYATNKRVYLYYTSTDAPNPHNRISRFTVNDSNPADYSFVDTTANPDPLDETIIFELDPLSGATNHNGGAIHFGADGKLYAAVGDNALGSNAQTLNNLHGKMLRINPDGTIPADNPFFGTAAGKNRAIHSLGLRNPFTFAFRPGTNEFFVNDVGQNSFEEISNGVAGANYGWPGVEGNSGTPPTGPGTYVAPLYVYGHGTGPLQGFAIAGGAFYNPATQQFPSDYAGDYFFGDVVTDFIARRDSSTGQVTQFATGASGVVDLKVTPDGSLLYLARDSGGVFRVRFTAAQAPSISQQPANATVATGGTATFTVAANGAGLSYQWQKLSGSTWSNLANGTGVSGAATATLTLTNAQAATAGSYRVVVSNGFGSVTSNAAALTVTANQAPTATVSITGGLRGGKFDAGTPVTFSGTATDLEDGTLGAAAFTWKVEYVTSIASGQPIVRPFVPEFSNAAGGTFTPATTGPYTLTDVAYRVTLTARDSQNAATTTTFDVSPNVSTITLASSPTGLVLTVDGQPYTAPASLQSVVGFQRPIGAAATQTLGGTTYNFVSWSDGGAATHTVSTPAANATYTATYAPAAYPANLDFSGGFASAGSLLRLNGSAVVTNGRVRLTNGTGNQRGSAFSAGQLNVTNFATSFTFQLTNPNADGMTFTIQNVGPGALGPSGGGLGYGPDNTAGAAGIGSSVAVKFDIYSNQGEGANSTGLYLNGAAPTNVGSRSLDGTGINLKSGNPFRVGMAYDGSTLRVTITDTVTGASNTQAYSVNIPAAVGGNAAYVGFTGGTGGLTATQEVVNWTYTPAVGVYSFSEASGTATADGSAQGNNGTLVGGATRTPGRVGGGVAFDGTGRVELAGDLNRWLGGTATVAFWMRTTQVGNDTSWLAPGVTGVESAGDGNDVFWGWLDAAGRVGVQAGDGAAAKSANPVNDGTWHHVALTRDAATGVVQVYVDGVLSGTATSEAGVKTTPFRDLGRVGDTGGTPASFVGALDEFRAYNRVLTAEEIRSLV